MRWCERGLADCWLKACKPACSSPWCECDDHGGLRAFFAEHSLVSVFWGGCLFFCVCVCCAALSLPLCAALLAARVESSCLLGLGSVCVAAAAGLGSPSASIDMSICSRPHTLLWAGCIVPRSDPIHPPTPHPQTNQDHQPIRPQPSSNHGDQGPDEAHLGRVPQRGACECMCECVALVNETDHQSPPPTLTRTAPPTPPNHTNR